MLETTPQERLALVVIAILLTGGAVGRYAVARADAADWLEYSAEAADTLSPGSSAVLRERVEGELASQRIRATPLGPEERIDPNRAPAEQLDRLPRIGPALADRIVAYREANGPFRSVEELRAVPGIGAALLEGIAPHLALPRTAGGPRAGSAQRIDLNAATARELESLPGIGPAIAERIVEYRRVHGRFRSFEEVEKVPGIGARLRERLEAEARLGP